MLNVLLFNFNILLFFFFLETRAKTPKASTSKRPRATYDDDSDDDEDELMDDIVSFVTSASVPIEAVENKVSISLLILKLNQH